MAKSKALGRGLANLLPDFSTADSIEKLKLDYQELPLENIQRNPRQPRKYFAKLEIQELASTILDLGIIEPIIVRLVDSASIQKTNLQPKYEIISGERRFQAAQIAGYKKIPAIIRKATEIQALELGIIENVQRENLNPVEEAQAYQSWLNKTGYKPSALAKKIGKNRSTVTNLIRILKLPKEVLDAIVHEKLTVGQARPLLSITSVEHQKALMKKVIQYQWNARRVENEVNVLLQSKQTPKPLKKIDVNTKRIEDQLIRALQTKVRIENHKNNIGVIKLYYSNLDECERLINLLKKKNVH